MRAFVVSALLASVSHARRVQTPFDQAASSSGKDSSRDSARVLEMLALATSPHRNTLPALARSASTVMGGWGGAKNEHGHTRELNLDIPGEIADGAFLMDDDDMYGEESYEEHKPYTGLHPSELKTTASSSSSGGYELEDFGSSGGSPGGYELEDFGSSGSGGAGDFGGAKNEHGHTRVLNLDIPASISTGAFTDYDDDLYGEESYEEHKPYTGAHPSEQKTASSGSSGGYQLEDFGSSGSGRDFSNSGGAGDWGGAKNEHGHTRVLNLDIPASISTGAFTDYDDDLYGEESYEEHKPYTGAHPSEQKSASSGSSGGYQLEDFSSSGSGGDFGSSGGAGDWGGAKNEHGHTRVLNLDIPASISDGAFTDYGDDLYGEESYEEHKPYTGL